MPVAFEFTLDRSDLTPDDSHTLVIMGDDLRFPESGGLITINYFRVYRTLEDGRPVFVQAIRDYLVRSVRGLSEKELNDYRAGHQDKEHQARRALAAALDHIDQLIGYPRRQCSFVDGSVLEGGVTQCMTHNRPGSAPGKCAVDEAVEFIAAHRSSS